MQNFKLGYKIGGGFAGISVILATVVVWTFVDSRLLKSTADEAYVMYQQVSMLKDMKFHIAQVQQWLTDISATRGRDGLNDGFDEAESHKGQFKDLQQELLKQYQLRDETELVVAVEQLGEKFDAYYEVGRKMAQGYVSGGPAVGNKMMGEFDQAAEELHMTFGPIMEAEIEEFNSLFENLDHGMGVLARNVAMFGGMAILFGCFIGWSITRVVTMPIRNAVAELHEGALQVNSSSNQLSSTSQQIAEGASEQAASLEETSSSLEEMAAMTRRNADNANEANNIVKESNDMVHRANSSMRELNDAMEEISKASEDTSKIIKTIDEIAFQTNLLALNAAVEAARAGEAGSGFAVVADEVRNLAMRAADAAKNTAQLIEGTVIKVKDGRELLNTTNEAFSGVAESSSKVGQLVGEIAAASNEQAQGIEQVNRATNEMDKVVQENAAAAEEAASASEELAAQAATMNGAVIELAVLVDGETARQQIHVERDMPQPLKRPPMMREIPAPKALPAGSGAMNMNKNIDPEDVIPMDDEDFKDF